MPLDGQGCDSLARVPARPHSRFDDGGFTMVVLLVVMAVMAIGMTAMLPRWHQQAIREKEAELVFRGQQYARAIVLYSRKNNNVLPPSIDALYEGKYLRKKWKDPITGEDFGLLPAGQPVNINTGGGLPQGPGSARGTPAPQPGASGGRQMIIGSFQGVYSPSTDTSIRVYQNQQRYIDWPFTVQTAQVLMGTATGGPAGSPGGSGGPSGGPGGGRSVPGGPGGTGPVPPRGGQPPPARGGRGST